jgi:type IV secretory pathway ATPase VirB11/archaellum biosynthesis ATPase
VVSGGTGSGKTTLLGVLSSFIPDEERLITIEDAAELRLGKPHVVSLEARPANVGLCVVPRRLFAAHGSVRHSPKRSPASREPT